MKRQSNQERIPVIKKLYGRCKQKYNTVFLKGIFDLRGVERHGKQAIELKAVEYSAISF